MISRICLSSVLNGSFSAVTSTTLAPPILTTALPIHQPNRDRQGAEPTQHRSLAVAAQPSGAVGNNLTNATRRRVFYKLTALMSASSLARHKLSLVALANDVSFVHSQAAQLLRAAFYSG